MTSLQTDLGPHPGTREFANADEPQVIEPGMPLAPGYDVVGLLRRGHRLDVYEVWSHARRTRCVAKVVRPDRVAEPHTTLLLRQEGELLRELDHPHLVRAYEVVELQPSPVVVMETLVGLTLEQSLQRPKRLAAREVALLGAQLTSALLYLHDRAIVHGDLSAGNVMLDGGTTKLIDLSLAGPPRRVRRGAGTGGYRAPEQLAGGWLDEATDVWGLAAVLRRALLGRDLEEAPLEARHRTGRRLYRPRRDVTRRLLGLLDQCLVTSSTLRPSLTVLHAELARLGDEGLAAVSGPTGTRDWPRGR